MGTCKVCGLKYSLLQARGDGLCPTCGKKDDEQKELKQLEDANIRLKEIVANIAPDDEIDAFGVARWDTMGSKISSKFHLWVGRFLFGILGDILRSKIQVLGVIGISHKGFLYTGKIDEIDEKSSIDLASINNSKLNAKSVSKTPIGEVSTLHYGDTLEVELTGNKRLCATFPKCFIADNELMPKRIISILNEQQKMNIK